MYFFSITLVAGSAAIVLFGLSALYSASTGVPYFVDSEIPAAVFLGLHLLVTDPSTSPKTPLGKALFGGLYGLGVFGLFALLGAMGAPTFYDKLLCVPLLNLSVQRIDALARSIRAIPFVSRWEDRVPAGANAVYIAIWIGFFGVMTAIGSTDGTHRGDAVPFWEQACEDGRRNACDRLLQIEASYCGDNSAWACNELGGHYRQGTIVAPDAELANDFFSRACELRSRPGCFNVLDAAGRDDDRGISFIRTDPRVLDLRLLLREGGQNLMDMAEPDLYARGLRSRLVVRVRSRRPLMRSIGIGRLATLSALIVVGAVSCQRQASEDTGQSGAGPRAHSQSRRDPRVHSRSRRAPWISRRCLVSSRRRSPRFRGDPGRAVRDGERRGDR